MNDEWKTVPAIEFCDSVRDGTHDSPKPVAHGEFLITSRHIVGRQLDLSNAYQISKTDFDAINRRSKVDQWDVLITMIGTVGEPCLVKSRPNFAIKNIGLFKSKNEETGKWLYYYLQSPDGQSLIRQQSRGSTQQYIPLGALRALPVSVPCDPREMKAIVDVLGSLDDKIEQNRRTARALERLARAIFRAWFVDFEPVKAKAEGATSFPSMPQEVFDALPTRLIDSEIGPVPKGWAVKPLDNVADFLNGLALQKYPPRGDGTDLPVIKIAQLRKGSTEGADASNDSIDDKYKIQDRDLLFSWSGTLEAVFWFGGTGALNQHLFKVTSRDYPQWLLYEWIHQHLSEFRLIAASKATTMGHIKRGHLSQAMVAVPPAAFLEQGNQLVSPLFEMNASARLESRELAEMRDYLLPKLLSGDVRVDA